MHTSSTTPGSDRLAIVGVLLVVAGLAAVALRAAGVDVFDAIARAGWPLFIILPGLVLLVGAVVVAPPGGLGFAIAGTIVTSIGLLLWYQDTANHYESWAYAWALIGPGAAGLAMLVYGAMTRQADLVRAGSRLVVIAAAIFAVGFLFFESIFGEGRVPFDLGAWWPAGLIVLGIVIVVGSLLGARTATSEGRPGEDAGEAGGEQR